MEFSRYPLFVAAVLLPLCAVVVLGAGSGAESGVQSQSGSTKPHHHHHHQHHHKNVKITGFVTCSAMPEKRNRGKHTLKGELKLEWEDEEGNKEETKVPFTIKNGKYTIQKSVSAKNAESVKVLLTVHCGSARRFRGKCNKKIEGEFDGLFVDSQLSAEFACGPVENVVLQHF